MKNTNSLETDTRYFLLTTKTQLEQKSKKVRSLEESLQQMEGRIFELDSERKQLDDQVQHWKNEAVENKEKIREEVHVVYCFSFFLSLTL